MSLCSIIANDLQYSSSKSHINITKQFRKLLKFLEIFGSFSATFYLPYICGWIRLFVSPLFQDKVKDDKQINAYAYVLFICSSRDQLTIWWIVREGASSLVKLIVQVYSVLKILKVISIIDWPGLWLDSELINWMHSVSSLPGPGWKQI